MKRVAIVMALAMTLPALPVAAQDAVTVVPDEQFCNLVSDDLASCEQALATLASARMLPEAFASLLSPADTGGTAEEQGARTGASAASREKTQSRSDVAVTVTDVDWDVEGNPFVPPGDGNQFVAVHVIYEALKDDAFPGTWTAVDEDGFTHSQTFFSGVEPALQPFQQLRAGNKTQGWIAFEVPASTSRLELVESAFLGDDLVWTVEK